MASFALVFLVSLGSFAVHEGECRAWDRAACQCFENGRHNDPQTEDTCAREAGTMEANRAGQKMCNLYVPRLDGSFPCQEDTEARCRWLADTYNDSWSCVGLKAKCKVDGECCSGTCTSFMAADSKINSYCSCSGVKEKCNIDGDCCPITWQGYTTYRKCQQGYCK